MLVELTDAQAEALRAAYPARLGELTKAIAREVSPEWKAHLRLERDALDGAFAALVGAGNAYAG